MSAQDPHSNEEDLRPPSQGELPGRARHVWQALKFFFSGILLIALLVIGIAGFWLLHTFGFTALFGVVILAASLFLLCRHLLTN